MFDDIDPSIKEFIPDNLTVSESDTPSIAVAVIGFNALIYVTIRYAPEYLRVLGVHSALIGFFGSLGILLAVICPYLGARVRALSTTVGTKSALGAVASLGLLLWLGAPQLGQLLPVPAWVWVFIGLVFIGLWKSLNLEAMGVLAENSLLCDRLLDDRASNQLIRLVSLISGILFVICLLAAVVRFTVGFQIAVALTASLGLVVSVLRYDATASGSVPTLDFRGYRQVIDDVWTLRELRPLLVGDTLVQFALGMVLVYIIIIVTSVLTLDVHLFGYRLDSSMVFGILLLVELSVAAATCVPGTRLAASIGRRKVVLASLLISVSFPLALVSAPADPIVIGALFAVFGLRFAGRPARRTLIATETARAADGDSEATESYRLVRNVVTIPSALVGGLVYTMSPVLAFGLATIIGFLGVREFLSYMAQPYYE